MSLLTKVFGTKNERELKKVEPLIAPIGEFEGEMKSLSDDQLRARTGVFREKIDQGASLDDLLLEAFAVVREAGLRALKMRHFDTQLIGGIVLHHGKIAEMKTGVEVAHFQGAPAAWALLFIFPTATTWSAGSGI